MNSRIYTYSGRTLQALVERALARHGTKTAIIAKEASLSYADVEDRARRLAHYAHGVYEETDGRRLLGIYGIYGADAYVAVYASLVAGGGYVPLNPAFPVDRLAFMLRDSGLRLLYVCDRSADEIEKLLPHLPGGTRILVPDSLLGARPSYPRIEFVPKRLLADEPAGSQFPAVPETACAYILYTSGSTGTPKGVMVSHANVSHYVGEMVSLYGFTGEDRFSQTFDLTFDLSVIGTFCAPAVGAVVCPMEKLDKLSPVRYVNAHRISVWSSVPSLAVNMQKLRMLKPGTMPSLRVSVFCGEPLTVACASQWRSAAANSRVENIYGPTEATVSCSRFLWDEKAQRQQHRNDIVPIGLPLPGTGFAVMDAEGNFVQDSPGELCISGPQVCLGYTDPEKTASAFFQRENPHFLTPERWYKTGDIVVYNRRKNAFEFLGRKDSQVQVQGNRVELGEVESVIRAASGCQAVVVIPYPVENGSAKGLVAFLERFPQCPDEESIREACRSKLPEYMCPGRFVFLDALPLNANQKYDRNALREECEQNA